MLDETTVIIVVGILVLATVIIIGMTLYYNIRVRELKVRWSKDRSDIYKQYMNDNLNMWEVVTKK